MRPSGSKIVTRNAHPFSRGFTLIEAVLSMAVMTIVMAGTASVILVASHALPSAQNPGQALTDSGDVVGQIAGELAYATSFTKRSATAVTFTVADRGHGAAGPETVRYAWSGTPGEPLTRQYNGGTAVTIAEDVQEFDLSYSTRTVTTETQGGPTTSDEFMMAKFEGWDGIPPYPLQIQVTLVAWVAEFFTVSGVPPEATGLTITRVELQMCQCTLLDAGTFSVGIHDVAAPGNPEPATDPIGTPVVVSSSTLNPYPTFDWEEFKFSDVVISSPGTEYVIVVKGFWPDIYSFDAQVLRYADSNAPADDTVAVWTADSGSTWNPKPAKRDQYDCLFRVYGTYETPGGGPVEETRYFITGVNVQLRAGPDASTRLETDVQVLNAPEVTNP